ncbi:hypothetical protein COI93_00990 [Bacillus cereus]|uniref:Anti-sigma factor n=1 Tax=Bacillus cereus TaxID=1396 RepID=A0A2B0MST0_BACCE|nr:hypothetical protein COI93_00990 [Bacillus cereus]
MDFEKHLRDELQRKAAVMEPSRNLQKRVGNSFAAHYQVSKKGRRSMKKRLLIACIAIAVLIPTGTFAGTTLIDKIIGTPQEAKRDMGMGKDGYKGTMERVEIAKKLFTKEEFEKYVALLKESYHFYKKVSVMENGERKYTSTEHLSPEEKKRDSEVIVELQKYEEKLDAHFTYTFEQAEKITDFPIKHPTYIPQGHHLVWEEAKADATTGKPRPLITMRYEDSNVEKGPTKSEADLGFRLYQFGVFDEQRDYGVEKPFDQVTEKEPSLYKDIKTYTLKGYNITFGEYKGLNVRGMKLVVPARKGRSSYQVYINESKLSKQELEKILLSVVE